MISIYFIMYIIIAHFIGDFILQSDYHALNKSTNNLVLFNHIMWYLIPFIPIGLFFTIKYYFIWIILNGTAHYITDYITSRATSKLWQSGKRHWFFVVIGLDQAAHYSFLFLTYMLLR